MTANTRKVIIGAAASIGVGLFWKLWDMNATLARVEFQANITAVAVERIDNKVDDLRLWAREAARDTTR